jgi:hypothetical protein
MSFITQGLGAGGTAPRLILLGFFAGEPVIPTVLGARGVAPGQGLEDNPPRRTNLAQGRRAVMAGTRRTNTATGGRRN